MPEKPNPISLHMQQDVKQTQKWRRQTLTNGQGSTDNGSKSQLKQSWARDGAGGTAKYKTNWTALRSFCLDVIKIWKKG